jgi:phosphoglycerol transferase MdoB-like AlkP superfamily enzyme
VKPIFRHPPLVFVLKIVLLQLALLTLFRIVFTAIYLKPIDFDWPSLARMLANGLRFDAAAVVYLVLPFLAFTWQTRYNFMLVPTLGWAVGGLHYVLTLIALLLSSIDLGYYAFFSSRINTSFIVDIQDFGEVMKMIAGLKITYIFLVVFLAAAYGYARMLKRLLRQGQAQLARPDTGTPVRGAAWIAAVVSLVLAGLAARGGPHHRPLKANQAYFTSVNFYNQAGLNSLFALADAAQNYVKVDYREYMPINQALAETKKLYAGPGDTFVSAAYPLLRKNNVPGFDLAIKKNNVVVVLLESFDAAYVPATGGKDIGLTPNFVRLAQEGICFDRFYATGWHSRNGLMALLAGFPNIPNMDGLYARTESKHAFFSLVELFNQQGYATSLLYGGNMDFENMRAQVRIQGFATLQERRDFPGEKEWNFGGVSDRVLFNRAHAYFSDLAQQGRPFFSLVYTTTNHAPWRYPDDGPPARQFNGEPFPPELLNTIRYTDHALGEFFRQVKTGPYYHNTLFIITGDHAGCRSLKGVIESDDFHIPCLVLCPALFSTTGRTDHTLGSLTDLPATILDLCGMAGPQPTFGRSLFDTTRAAERAAVITYHDTPALRCGDYYFVNSPQPELLVNPAGKKYDWQKTVDLGLAAGMRQKLLAIVQSAQYVVLNHRYFGTEN